MAAMTSFFLPGLLSVCLSVPFVLLCNSKYVVTHSACLSVHLSICMSVCVFVCPRMYFSVCLLSVCPYLSLSICLSFCDWKWNDSVNHSLRELRDKKLVTSSQANKSFQRKQKSLRYENILSYPR
jgi:hypothetical protein